MHTIATILAMVFFYNFSLYAEFNESSHKGAYTRVITRDDYDEEDPTAEGVSSPEIDDDADQLDMTSSDVEEEELKHPKTPVFSIENTPGGSQEIPISSYLEERFAFLKRSEKDSFRLSTHNIKGKVHYHWLKDEKNLLITFSPCIGEHVRAESIEFSLTDDGALNIDSQQSVRSFGVKKPRTIKKKNINYIVELIKALKTIK